MEQGTLGGMSSDPTAVRLVFELPLAKKLMVWLEVNRDEPTSVVVESTK